MKTKSKKEIIKEAQKRIAGDMIEIIRIESPDFYIKLVNSIESAKEVLRNKKPLVSRHNNF